MRGCFFGLIAYGIAIALYAEALRPYIDSPLHIVAGVVGALFSLGLVNVLFIRARVWRDSRLIRAAEAREAPVDGRMTAVIGTLSPVGGPLRSPIGDLPCVAYEYDIGADRVYHRAVSTRRGRHRDGRTHGPPSGKTRYSTTMYAGVAMAPAAISTLHGAVRLLSFPVMDGFEQERRSGPTARDRAQQHIARVAPPRQGFLDAVVGFAGTPTDSEGGLRRDMRLVNEVELPPAIWSNERVVPAGALVCAIGRYSADRRGLGGRGAGGVRLLPGQADEARAYLRKSNRTQLAMSIVLFLVFHAAIVGGAYLGATRYQRDLPEQQAATLIRLMSDGDQEAIARAIQRGANPNALNTAGEAAVHVVTDPATVRTLAAAGADINATHGAGRTPLMLAVMRQQPEMVQAWLAAGAKVNLARVDGATALSDAEEAGEQDIADLLRAVGGLCDHVNAERGRQIGLASAAPSRAGATNTASRTGATSADASSVEATPRTDGADTDDRDVVQAVHAYLAAVHAKDIARLNAMTVGHSPGFYESVDYEVWRKTRPPTAAGAQGYRNTQAATITLPAFDTLGQPIVWAYQLRHIGDDWKIAREWLLPTAPSAPAAGDGDSTVAGAAAGAAAGDAASATASATAPVELTDDVERPRQDLERPRRPR